MAKKSSRSNRPPRIRVPNNERAIFTVDAKKFVGVIRRLSLTGGSAVLSNPIPQGTLAEMDLGTVFGKVSAQIQFMHSGADGMPTAQAFRFIDIDQVSSKRFSAAVRKMEKAGFSDVEGKENPLGNLASQTLDKLRDGIRTLSGAIAPGAANKS
ncbi:MAG TPA: hypothetical protein VK706_15845 [Candidatus Sulfotelmatobacter sp.]|jgi:hypothetical protein|nr:hypothetical protein [Candidatus Sulfotelmatobacter sp.]